MWRIQPRLDESECCSGCYQPIVEVSHLQVAAIELYNNIPKVCPKKAHPARVGTSGCGRLHADHGCQLASAAGRAATLDGQGIFLLDVAWTSSAALLSGAGTLGFFGS